MPEFVNHGRRLSKLWPRRVFYGWAIVYVSFLISMAQVPMYGPVFSVFVKPIEEELGWSRSTITMAFVAGSAGGSLMAAVIGSALDRYGSRGVMAWTGLIVAMGLLGVAAMSEPWHFWVAYGVARAAAVAGVSLGTTVAVANWFVRMRGRAMAIRAAGQRGGQAIVPLLILPVLLLAGWREAFVVFAVASVLLITIPSLVWVRRRPEDFGLDPDGAVMSNSNAPQASASEHSWTLGQIRSSRTLWMLIIGMSTGIAAHIAINVHAVANFQDKGMSDGLAVTIVSVFTGVAALSMAGWGLLLERIHVRFVTMISLSLFIVSLGVVLVAETYLLGLVFAVLFGLGTGGWTVSQMIMIPNYFGRLHAGSIKGFIAPIEGLVGISGPLIAAYIFDMTKSYDYAFVGAIAAFVIGIVAFYLAKPFQASRS